eukprot:Sspe_Gene.59381::Locus_32597_Transcript_1_1_Confidence_1.000_Length_455::g.59381::m.59381
MPTPASTVRARKAPAGPEKRKGSAGSTSRSASIARLEEANRRLRQQLEMLMAASASADDSHTTVSDPDFDDGWGPRPPHRPAILTPPPPALPPPTRLHQLRSPPSPVVLQPAHNVSPDWALRLLLDVEYS